MDHLYRLTHLCRTCDYGISAQNAYRKGWLECRPGADDMFCCLDRKVRPEAESSCPRWCSSYDGYNARAAASLPESV
ncbi:MAG: hypothetical protein AB7E32_17820 [Desulfovibrio sp.]